MSDSSVTIRDLMGTPSAPTPAPDALGEPWSGEGRGDDRPKAPVIFKSAVAFCSEYKPVSYAVEPIVRSGSLYTLTAKTGSGKTGVLLSVALAVATGRGNIIGREVAHGRVAYIAAENPDDLRMRLMAAAFIFNVDLLALGSDLVILDARARPEDLLPRLQELEHTRPFPLIIVDTLAAFFDGSDANDNVQTGEFMRRLRPATKLRGSPSVLVAAHPTKGAADDQLTPYGGGAILNEVDGNLCLSRPAGGLPTLHWQGKLRGVEFEPVHFRVESVACPDVIDCKGRQVLLPVFMPATEHDAEERRDSAQTIKRALLRAMAAEPSASQATWAATIGCSKSTVNGALQGLKSERLAEATLGKWSLTPKGKNALDQGQ